MESQIVKIVNGLWTEQRYGGGFYRQGARWAIDPMERRRMQETFHGMPNYMYQNPTLYYDEELGEIMENYAGVLRECL